MEDTFFDRTQTYKIVHPVSICQGFSDMLHGLVSVFNRPWKYKVAAASFQRERGGKTASRSQGVRGARWASFRGPAAIVFLWGAFCRPVGAQKDLLFEEAVPTKAAEQTRSRIETGILYSGAEAEDLDKGIFAWDYVTYTSYRFRIDDKTRLRAQHQYWKYLSGNYRNVYELGLRRQLDGSRALSVSADFLDEKTDYHQGAVYLGYEDTIARDWRWYVQAGGGLDSGHEWQGSLYLDTVKPLTRSTLLRLRNEYVQSTSGYRSDTFRANIIQALHRRLALNLGYRLFLNKQIQEGAEDLTSHEGSAALVYQLRDDLFLTGRYRRYWNNAELEADAYALETRWNLTSRLIVLGGYQLQQYRDGPANHSFRIGVSLDF